MTAFTVISALCALAAAIDTKKRRAAASDSARAEASVRPVAKCPGSGAALSSWRRAASCAWGEGALHAAPSCEQAYARGGSLRTFPAFCARKAFRTRAAASFREIRLRAAFSSSRRGVPDRCYCRERGPAMDIFLCWSVRCRHGNLADPHRHRQFVESGTLKGRVRSHVRRYPSESLGKWDLSLRIVSKSCLRWPAPSKRMLRRVLDEIRQRFENISATRGRRALLSRAPGHSSLEYLMRFLRFLLKGSIL